MRTENLVGVGLLALVASVLVAAVSVAAQDPAAIEAVMTPEPPTRRLIRHALTKASHAAAAAGGRERPAGCPGWVRPAAAARATRPLPASAAA